jgi:hypothetical protein
MVMSLTMDSMVPGAVLVGMHMGFTVRVVVLSMVTHRRALSSGGKFGAIFRQIACIFKKLLRHSPPMVRLEAAR